MNKCLEQALRTLIMEAASSHRYVSGFYWNTDKLFNCPQTEYVSE
jgi:hypothetical protein